MNKAGGGDGIPVELFRILEDDAVKVLHSICQQIWKTQQWPQDWKTAVFIPIPKKGNAKECSNYRTIALISHASKVMLKILQARLQQHVNCEPPDVIFISKVIEFLLAILIPAWASSSLAFLMMYYAYKLNKQGDNKQPWCTPFSVLNQSVVQCLVLTVASCTHVSQEQVKWSDKFSSL